MAVNVRSRNLRASEDLRKLLQGCCCLGTNIGLAEVEEDAIFQGDGCAAALDGLEAIDLGELTNLANGRCLVSLHLLAVHRRGAIAVVDDAQVRAVVDATALAIKAVGHRSLAVAVVAGTVGANHDVFAGLGVVVDAGTVRADRDVQSV